MEKQNKVCMIAYSSYTDDARIKSYVKTLCGQGVHVDLLVLKDGDRPEVETGDKTRVMRLCAKYQGSNSVLYILSYVYFLAVSFLKVSRLFLKERYSVIHVHNMPNFLVFAAILPKMLGAKVILDIHDLMVPIYTAKFDAGDRHWLVRMLALEQSISARFASHVICADHMQKQELTGVYGIPEDKINVVINLPHEGIFKRIPAVKDPSTFNLIYHGTIARRLGIDLMLEAVARVREKLPVRLTIIGKGDFLGEVKALQKKLGLDDIVYISGFLIPAEDLSAIICRMDAGIIANRRTLATEKYMMPVKLMEYAYLKIPVIAPRLTIIQYYFKEDMVKYYEPENVDELSTCILDLFRNRDERDRLACKALGFFDRYNSQTNFAPYIRLVSGCVPDSPVIQKAV
jgi:glycosyltransferase involved in cell wall biosynthesis